MKLKYDKRRLIIKGKEGKDYRVLCSVYAFINVDDCERPLGILGRCLIVSIIRFIL